MSWAVGKIKSYVVSLCLEIKNQFFIIFFGLYPFFNEEHHTNGTRFAL